MGEPTAITRLQTQRFLFTPDEKDDDFANVQWSESLPILVQAKLVQSFENFDIAHAPLRHDSGVEGAPRLLIDLRRFEILREPQPRAVIAFSARIVDAGGRQQAAKVFQQSSAIDQLAPATAAAAFDRAFSALATELIAWVGEAEH
jgi:phospholipid/cholesterol/gamma-HCH transport system substrate-binding protein